MRTGRLHLSNSNSEALINIYDIVDVAINGEFTQRLLACYTLEALARIHMFGDKKFLEITKKLRGLTNIVELSDSAGGVYCVTLLTGDNADLTVIGATNDWSETHQEILAAEELAYLSVFLEVPHLEGVNYEDALREWLNWMLDVFNGNLVERDSNMAKISEGDFRDFIEQAERLIRSQRLNVDFYYNPMLKISNKELRHNWNFILSSFSSPNKSDKGMNFNSDGSKKASGRNNRDRDKDRDYDDDRRDNNRDRNNNSSNSNNNSKKDTRSSSNNNNRRDDNYDYDRDRRDNRDDDRYDTRSDTRSDSRYDQSNSRYDDDRRDNRSIRDYDRDPDYDSRRNSDGTWKRDKDEEPNDRRQSNRPNDNRRNNSDVRVTNKPPVRGKPNVILERDSIFGSGFMRLFGGGNKETDKERDERERKDRDRDRRR